MWEIIRTGNPVLCKLNIKLKYSLYGLHLEQLVSCAETEQCLSALSMCVGRVDVGPAMATNMQLRSRFSLTN